jgi:hypothetical protein
MKIDPDTTETLPKLKLNVDDNAFFRKYIIDGSHNTTLPSRESHKRIKRAYEIAVQHIQDILKPHNKQEHKTARLLEWRKFVESGAEVIVLRVPDHLNAFVMFETLNDRGLKASQADLLKNDLLQKCGDGIIEGQQKWSKTLGTLEAIGHGDITLTYLHHMLIKPDRANQRA